jgi:hypothetical protein
VQYHDIADCLSVGHCSAVPGDGHPGNGCSTTSCKYCPVLRSCCSGTYLCTVRYLQPRSRYAGTNSPGAPREVIFSCVLLAKARAASRALLQYHRDILLEGFVWSGLRVAVRDVVMDGTFVVLLCVSVCFAYREGRGRRNW